MPTFIYTATNNEGKIISGELDTADKKAVITYLNKQDLTTISVKPKKEKINKFTNLDFFGLSIDEKILLTKHLSTIIRAGLSMKEGIETILHDTKKKTFRKILTEIKFNLEKGQPVSVTLKKYPKIFSDIFVSLIEAGEISGTMERSLDYLGRQLEKERQLKQKVIGAMVYPFILIIASIAVIFILMIFVVPRLSNIFLQNNTELPWSTKLIMSISSFLSNNIFIIIIIVFIVSTCLFYFRKRKSVQGAISEMIVKTPFISDLYEKIILARFTRTLGTLLSSGIHILKAIDISTEILGYNRYQRAAKRVRLQISQGVSMGNALRKEDDIFPYLLINMVSVGEKTGNVDSILGELANFYENEIDNSLKNIVSLLEPMLLLIMGLIVATLAFSVIMPIYQLVGSIS